MLNRLTLWVCFAACFAVLSGCGANTHVSTGPSTPQLADVYVAGVQEDVKGRDFAIYWKNGIPAFLPDQNLGSMASGIVVSGPDVYVSGTVNNGTEGVATYWKNGVAFPLTDGSKNAAATSIFVAGGDVYVAGFEFKGQGFGYPVAEYWKNGVVVNLTDGSEPAEAWSIFVSGNDVYVAGAEEQTTQTGPSNFVVNNVAKYWKNGTPVALTDGLEDAHASSIFVSGSDVYVAGDYCKDMVQNCAMAAYWKNGTLLQLTDKTDTAASSIFVSGAEVYVTGNEGGTATSNPTIVHLWENGVDRQLPLSGQAVGAASNQVVVSGGDIYVVGGEDFGGVPQRGMAVYWKDGVEIPVSDADSLSGPTFASGRAIAVVPPVRGQN